MQATSASMCKCTKSGEQMNKQNATKMSRMEKILKIQD